MRKTKKSKGAPKKRLGIRGKVSAHPYKSDRKKFSSGRKSKLGTCSVVSSERMNRNNYMSVTGLEFSYGEVQVLHGLEFELPAQSVCCVMGRNGVGKTTFLRNIVGLEKPSAGSVQIGGTEFLGLDASDRAVRGIGYVPQGRQIFPLLTVEENLSVALEAAPPDQRQIPTAVYDTFPVLYDMRKRRGGDLSGGQQQQLAIGRALTTRPKLLVLDEPTEGIQPNVITMIGEIIRNLVAQQGMTILLVEQYLDFVRSYGDSFAVMSRGQFVASGRVENLDSSTVHKHLSV